MESTEWPDPKRTRACPKLPLEEAERHPCGSELTCKLKNNDGNGRVEIVSLCVCLCVWDFSQKGSGTLDAGFHLCFLPVQQAVEVVMAAVSEKVAGLTKANLSVPANLSQLPKSQETCPSRRGSA